MKKISIVLVLLLGISAYLQNPSLTSHSVDSQASSNNQSVSRAFNSHLSNIQVLGSGQVSRILRDDNQGRRHQKFILHLPSGQSLLIAHNIDLAPRIKDLKKGDSIEFYGEYEWNSKGGIVHWTHHDPSGRHIDGWLKHNSRMYH